MQENIREYRRHTRVNEHGAALTVGLGLLAVCALWGVMTLTTDPAALRTAENYRQIATYYAAGNQALYAAEAGAEEGRARLRTYPGLYHIVDQEPNNPAWQMIIGPQRDAYDLGSEKAVPNTVSSVQQTSPYRVTIRHANTATAVLRWGDVRSEGLYTRNTSRGQPIYMIAAQGVQGEAQRTVEIETTPEPPPTVLAALHAGGPLRIHNQRTYVSGLDSCGTQHQPGVRTPLAPPAVGNRANQGTGTMIGQYGNAVMHGNPAVLYNSSHLQLQSMIDALKEHADVVYSPAAMGAKPTEGVVQWGNPKPGATLQTPSGCEERHVILYKTPNGRGYLGQGSSGCGVLLVEGDLVIQGDFSWYGALLVTGTVQLTGGGSKHITGGMVVAGEVVIESGGDTSVLYCSEAIAQQTRYLPLRVLSWREVASTNH